MHLLSFMVHGAGLHGHNTKHIWYEGFTSEKKQNMHVL